MHGCVMGADLWAVNIPQTLHMALHIPSFIHSDSVSRDACLPVGHRFCYPSRSRIFEQSIRRKVLA